MWKVFKCCWQVVSGYLSIMFQVLKYSETFDIKLHCGKQTHGTDNFGFDQVTFQTLAVTKNK